VVARGRRGGSRLGCLVGILFVVTVGYFGFNIGEVYWRYYQYLDAMKQEVRFARSFPDDAITRRLSALADSLGLPPDAGRVNVRRTSNRISISSDYSEHVELPLFVREFRFSPRVSGTL
jgi:hypothetical protein